MYVCEEFGILGLWVVRGCSTSPRNFAFFLLGRTQLLPRQNEGGIGSDSFMLIVSEE